MRHFLAAKGARYLSVPSHQVYTREGMARGGDNDAVFYADLVRGLDMSMRLDPDIPVNAVSDYRIVGQPTQRRDLPQKVRGDLTYIQDLKIEGMVHGDVIRPPYAGRDSGAFVGYGLIRYDEAAIADQFGFVAVVRQRDFWAVVVDRAALARHVAEALPVQWHMPPPDTSDLKYLLKAALSTPRAKIP